MIDIPQWTTNYVGREYIPPYGCYLLALEVLRDQFGKIDLPQLLEDLESSDLSTVKRRVAVVSQGLDNYFVEVPKEETHEGDIASIRVAGYPYHVGILVSDTHMLHSSACINAVIERLDSFRLRNRIGGFYRHA